uniref:2-oxoglutarate and iron dependent oxygenase domain containing 3 n=1 Tax=Pavo cristatus TaxID=9049 RepID=A0A8C9FCJ5_PAVCR
MDAFCVLAVWGEQACPLLTAYQMADVVGIKPRNVLEAGCTPRRCGRGVSDAVITREEAERIRRIAERGLSLGGSDGGASILDLHSGALSLGKQFVNLYRYFGDKIQDIFTEEDFALYRDVRQRIQQKIAQAFGISSSSMYLTKPTFFSRINSTEAKTTHDEYWHPHIDKVSRRL